ncbi:glycosyltransferase family 2 protein [Mannheimia indoligenes]|uniref:glycosyltransferase family 2 protein n=1 Tax=Mannheimia indoligenes TaxID=3103145 RepID=UPI002FE64451
MLSIIIPVYNTEHFLERCLNSIVSQFDEKEGEIILVNDGSTDNSEIICQEFEKKYPFIKYFKKQNGGLSSARNFGLDHASKDYVFFIDSDDWLDEKCISTVTSHLKNEATLDILTFGAFKVFGSETVLLNIKDFQTTDPLDALYFTLSHNGSDVYACNKIFSRKLFNELRFPEGRIYEDMYLIPQLFLKARNFKFIQYHGYAYFMNPNSITFGKINHKQFYNIWHRFILQKKINVTKEVGENLYDEIYLNVLNGFISTGFKTLNSSSLYKEKCYFYKKLKKIILIYFSKYKKHCIKPKFVKQLLAIFLLFISPKLFVWLYKKNNKRYH